MIVVAGLMPEAIVLIPFVFSRSVQFFEQGVGDSQQRWE
jgi:hypothetical protein